MNIIDNISVISNPDGKDFINALAERINKYQEVGLEVEVQFSATDTTYTALVIGKVNISDATIGSHKAH